LFDSSKTNYLANLNLLDPLLFASQINIVGDEVIFNNYNEQTAGLATFGLDETINFVSMLTFTANVDNGRFIPVMSGNNIDYLTNEVGITNKYGFIFPNNLSLDELDFTTWGLSFTGSVLDLSVVEVTNTNILNREEQ